MKVILSVIAVCLVMITTKLYIPEASADVDGMNSNELRRDRDFKRAVQDIVGDCQLYGNAYASGYVYGDSYVELKVNNNMLEIDC